MHILVKLVLVNLMTSVLYVRLDYMSGTGFCSNVERSFELYEMIKCVLQVIVYKNGLTKQCSTCIMYGRIRIMYEDRRF